MNLLLYLFEFYLVQEQAYLTVVSPSRMNIAALYEPQNGRKTNKGKRQILQKLIDLYSKLLALLQKKRKILLGDRFVPCSLTICPKNLLIQHGYFFSFFLLKTKYDI